mgnify:FL=1|jgi:hypothetical protein
MNSILKRERDRNHIISIIQTTLNQYSGTQSLEKQEKLYEIYKKALREMIEYMKGKRSQCI